VTTIVYRNGILAADTRAYSGDATPIGLKQKIFQVKYSDGTVSTFGISTPNPGFADEVKNWFVNDKSHDAQPILADRNFTALEIMDNGEVFYYSSNFTPSGPLIAPWFAIGSGVEYALGALEMGATAEEAVKAAAANDPWTGDVVQTITVLLDESGTADIKEEA
jgi:20S proteasome alpha/beta subunit